MLICPNCKNKYPSPTLVCPRCERELLPPSAIGLQAAHPESVQSGRVNRPKASRRPSTGTVRENMVEVHRGSAKEAAEMARLLEREGISCLIERVEAFDLNDPIGGGGTFPNEEGSAIKVPAGSAEKARALLDWEAQKQEGPGRNDEFFAGRGETLATCPACEAEISLDEISCPECGMDLDSDQDEMDEEEYFCSSCGESCNANDPICPTCGAHFDH